MLIKLEQSMQDLKTLESDVAELGDSIGADALGQEIDTLEEKVNAPGFWDDPPRARMCLSSSRARKRCMIVISP